MAGILTDAELAEISQDMDLAFLTLCNGRTITVHKEPIKTLVSQSSSENVFGFGENQKDPVFTYTPVTGVFPAMIIYGKYHPSPLNPEINVRVYAGPITIKVKQDACDFISNGSPIKHIEVDGKLFLIDGEPRRQMFLNSQFYFYSLKAIK